MSDDTEIIKPDKPKGVGGNGNLIPVQKGEIRNPNGKPKGTKNRQTVIRELLESHAFKKIAEQQAIELGIDAPKTILEQVLISLSLKAIHGDVAASKELLDGNFGKMQENVKTEHTFTQMGRVSAQPVGQHIEQSKEKPKELTFDVGSEPPSSEPEEEI